MRRVTGQLAELAATTAAEAERLLANAKQALRRAKAKADKLRERGIHDAAAGRRRGRLARAVNDLTELLEATRQIVAHTRQRQDFMAIATMLVGDPATVSDLPLSALTENAIRKAFAD